MDSRRLLTELTVRACPSEADHRAFLMGDLPELEAEAIGAHLDQCAECEERSQRIDESTDAVVSAIRHALPMGSTIGFGPTKASATSDSVTAPQYIAGHEILGEVGRGGMGVVFKARHVRLNRLVALKMILTGPFAHAEELLRFQVEGETLARLSHPSIVQIHEIGQSDGRPYFTMEWIDGGTLADRLEGPPLTHEAVAQLVERLARAVHYAHENGVVHRDLKPANILLAAGDQGLVDAKVTDFGLAKGTATSTNLTATGVVVGTPGYMAPEQARGDRLVGPAADVYSLGAILYELLSGHPPFPLQRGERKSPAEIISEVLDREPESPRRIKPSIPRDLAVVCLRCLEKNPAARYGSARELADDLQRFQKGEPVRAQSSGELRRVWKWAKRRPVIAGLVAAVAASLILGALVSTYFGLNARESADVALAAKSVAIEKEQVAERARQQAESARNESQRSLARSDFQEGRRLAELGRVGEGMHWMLAALRQTPDEEIDQSFREVLLLNMSAWSERLHRLRHVLSAIDEVLCVAFNSDGRLFAIGGYDRTVRVFHSDSGEPLGPVLMTEARIHAIAFSPDDRYLVAGGDAGYQQDEQSRFCRFELATGRELLPRPEIPDDLPVESVAFSRDGQTFCAGTGSWRQPGGGWVCRTDSGKRVAHIPLPKLPANRCLVVQGKGDSNFNLVAFGEQSPVHLASFDGKQASPWVEVERPLGVPHLGFRFSDQVVVGDATGVRAYEFPNGRRIENTSRSGGHDWLAEAPDGRFRLARLIHSDAPVSGPLKFWDARTGITQSLIGPEDTYHRAAFSPDGRRLLAVSRGGTIRMWDLALPSPRPGGENTAADSKRLVFSSMEFSRDRSSAVLSAGTGTGVARVWRSGDPLLGIDLPQPDKVSFPNVGPTGLSPDGGRVTTFYVGQMLQIWDVDKRTPLPALLNQGNGVSAQAIDPTGKMLASGDYGRNVRLWSLETGAGLGSPLKQSDIVYSLRFSPDGRFLAVSTTKDWNRVYGVRLWDVASRRQIGELIETGGASPARMFFNPEGTQLLTVASDGVRRWDTTTGSEIAPHLPHAGGANTLAFRPDRQQLATGSPTGVVRLWDAVNGQPIGIAMSAASPVTCLEYHPAGRWIAVGYLDGSGRLWDSITGQPIGPPIAQPGPILGITFPADSGMIRTAAADGTVRDWSLPQAFAGDPQAFQRSLTVWSGTRMDVGRGMSLLELAAWRESRSATPLSAENVGNWHETLAWDAEQAGDPESSRWHLDRLLAANPTDWRLQLRIGRSATNSHQLASAEVVYQRVAKLAPIPAMTDWYRQRSNECRGAEQWSTACWYLDRLIAVSQKDWRAYVMRSEVLKRLGEQVLAESDLAAAVTNGADRGFVFQLALDRARSKRWPEASQLYQRLFSNRPDDPGNSRAALVHLQAENANAYRQLCERLDERAKQPLTAAQANNIGAICAFAPNAVTDYQRLIATSEFSLVELEKMSATTRPPTGKHDYLNTLGSLLVRAGRHEEGILRLQEALKENPSDDAVYDWVFLAIAHHAQGNAKEAVEWLKKCQAVKGTLNEQDFWRTLEVKMLIEEAERLIEGAKKK